MSHINFDKIDEKDEMEKKDDKESPWDGASLLSKYSLFFMAPILKRAYKNKLKIGDLWAAPKADGCYALGKKLERNYNIEVQNEKRKQSFTRALWRTFSGELILGSLLDLFARCVAMPIQLVFLGWIIRDVAFYLNFGSTTNVILLTQHTTSNTSSLNQTLNINDNSAYPSNVITAIHPLYGDIRTEHEAHKYLIYDTVLLIIFTILSNVLSHPLHFQTQHLGMKLRVASSYMIYRKILRLSQSALSQTTVGQMINLLSNDVNRFDQLTIMLPFVVIAPLQALVSFTFLAIYYLRPVPTVVSMIPIVLYFGIQSRMNKASGKYRDMTAVKTDERMRRMNELICSMNIIKMYAWEKPFQKLIESTRYEELRAIAWSSVLKVINQTLFFNSSQIVLGVALITYVSLGYHLDAEIVFVSCGLANLVRLTLTLFFPTAVATCGETSVTCERINNFLMLPEFTTPINSTGSYISSDKKTNSKKTVSFDQVWCSWASHEKLANYDLKKLDEQSASESLIIRDLSLTLSDRDLLFIVGRVGSGKSSALLAILGELPVISGILKIEGRISYASQEPWIFSGTVRDNILLGTSFHPDRYAEVVKVCSLERDLEMLVEGDSTIVGERGVSLSGGQRARVNLARALYREADIYVLDDPLSAVDGPVARDIFDNAILKYLRKKTVILATHQLQFLSHATKVLIVDRELPAAFGTVQEVLESNIFKEMNYSKAAFEDAINIFDNTNNNHPRSRTSSEAYSEGTPNNRSRVPSLPIEEIKLLPLDPTGKMMESKEEGDVPLSLLSSDRANLGAEELYATPTECGTVLFYVRNAAGIILIIWFIITNIAAQAPFQMHDFFLSFWTDSIERHQFKNEDYQKETFLDRMDTETVKYIYIGLMVTCFITTLIRAATFYVGTYRASLNLHKNLFASIIRAPMSFFDFTPIGVLLNRFSRDLGFVDEILPQQALEIIAIVVYLATILVILVVLDFKNIVPTIILILVTYLLHSIASPTIIRLKQIEGVARSPIFTHVSTTLNGLATIRASKAHSGFLGEFDKHQDKHTSSWFSFICASRWFTLFLEWLMMIFVSLILAVIVSISITSTNASVVGLITFSLIFLPGPFLAAMKQLVELESQFTSVQRIKEFSELEIEEDSTKVDEKSFQCSSGQICFKDVSLSYFPNEPPVLKKICFLVKPGEKIGVVGRTGAGKSSIMSTLFRLYKYEGSVTIDGTDTKNLSLAQLRRAISIIPQLPVLFKGTIRSNLDPFDEYPDEQLWEALEAVRLKTLLAKHPDKLEYIIKEGGNNFSVGQRQLICLARAIVRRNQILVLDEATANVDPETDMFIQRTISEQFAHCTVLTIAHRLITIAKADRVLVLDRGEVKEFAAPSELIDDKTSLFSQMVEGSSGQAERIKNLIRSNT